MTTLIGPAAQILLSAQNPAFREFYEARGTREAKIAAGGPMIDDIVAALAYLEALYPGEALSEVCFIDQGGAENRGWSARIPRQLMSCPRPRSTPTRRCTKPNGPAGVSCTSQSALFLFSFAYRWR